MEQLTRRIDELIQALGYSGVDALIHEWVIGKNAERDRELMRYYLLDGLSIKGCADRYAEAHPDMQVSDDTVKRALKKRKHQVFDHFPG